MISIYPACGGSSGLPISDVGIAIVRRFGGGLAKGAHFGRVRAHSTGAGTRTPARKIERLLEFAEVVAPDRRDLQCAGAASQVSFLAEQILCINSIFTN